MTFGALELDPGANPAVLDTATWDPAKAWETLQALRYDWETVRAAAMRDSGFKPHPDCTLYRNSAVLKEDKMFVLAGLADGQRVLLEIGRDDGSELLGRPLGRIALAPRIGLRVYPTHAAELDRFCRLLCPEKGPQVLGTIPRLGIGSRMSAAAWPGVFLGMNQAGIAANAIQNSVRELNLLEDLKQGVPAQRNYYCGFGTIESGHTGATFEGLWVWGVLAALEHEQPLRYGADADHIQLKRGSEGLARAKRFLAAARYYSFYTLDVADVLDYQALQETSVGGAEAYLARKAMDESVRKVVVEWHRKPFRCGGRTYELDAATVGRCVGKYWDALDRLGELTHFIESLKATAEFDLELSIDEHPPEVKAFDCLTTDEEVLFLLREIGRRGLRITHLAPNFGVEKGMDYRGPDGLEGFERRIRSQYEIARDFGVMLDVHSGDDLSAGPRRAIRRATSGWHQFKISPRLQILFAETLQECHPGLFQRWWDDAWDYASREARQGYPFAAQCLAEYQENPHPAPGREVFQHYCFAFPGRRDGHGRFINREELYTLSSAFYRAYAERLSDYLCRLAEDLFSS